ncbi:MAG: hypothetical protein WBV82_30320 [Myxococcaceae bacterium]
MNNLRVFPLAALFAASVLATGCMSPYLKRAPNTPDPKPSHALVTGFVVRFESFGQEKSGLEIAIDTAQNAQLDRFGQQATKLLTEVLISHGYTASFDGQRTFKLDAVRLASSSATAAITGQWRHPDASHWGPDEVDSLFVKPMHVIGKLRTDGRKEYFAFIDVAIHDSGFFMKEPQVIVRLSVFDNGGVEVLDLRGLGYGESQFMFANRSPQNLMLALERGFESLKTVEVQPLGI